MEIPRGYSEELRRLISRINVRNENDLLAAIRDRIGKGGIVGNINLHACRVLAVSNAMREALRSAVVVHFDGVGARAVAAWLGGKCRERALRCRHLPYQVWAPSLLRYLEEKDIKVACIGGTVDDAEKRKEWFSVRHRRLRALHVDGYLSAERKKDVIRQIAGFRAGVVFVGMGMPRQEEFILEAKDVVPEAVWLPCGGWLDVYCGIRRDIDVRMARVGLGWLGRCINEPVYVLPRYARDLTFFVCLVGGDVLFRRRQPEAATVAEEEQIPERNREGCSN